MTTLDVVFGPPEIRLLPVRDLSQTSCVVFDVLRATSVFVTALAHGAESIQPVAEIADALAAHRLDPTALLAGERQGLKPTAEATGGIRFDLGNSPREFTRAAVAGRRIISTTTNGTRALRACAGAGVVLATAFLNLTATANWLLQQPPMPILLVCAGTGELSALEDVLAAGALIATLQQSDRAVQLRDSAEIATRAYAAAASSLADVLGQSANGRRLLANPGLRDDVAYCARRDQLPVLAVMKPPGILVRS